MFGPEKALRVRRALEGGADHPLVIRHPDSGEKTLYSGGYWMKFIRDLHEEESATLLDFVMRHVTQPAFSRRIQALEAWAGIDLVDRSSYPTRLTAAGETFHAQALEILGSLQTTRNMMRGHQVGTLDMIEFAVPHSLAFTFFPHWVTDLPQAGALLTLAILAVLGYVLPRLLAWMLPSEPFPEGPLKETLERLARAM